MAFRTQAARASLAPSLRNASRRLVPTRGLPTTTRRVPQTFKHNFQFKALRSITTSSNARATVSSAPLFSFADIPTETTTPQTLTEKIVQAHAVGLPEGKVVRSGDYVQIKPWRLMTHDNTAAVLIKFLSLGARNVKDPSQLVFAIDHDVTNTSPQNLEKYRKIGAFGDEQGVENYKAGDGIGHQLMVERAHVEVGKLCVASDSHSNHYGGIAALGTALVRSDAAAVWATGRSWFNVPPVAQVTFTGKLPVGVTGKDVIVALCGIFPTEVLNHSVEFAGSEETMASIPVDSRLTISNMSTEWSALSAMFPADKTLEAWMRNKATEAENSADPKFKERINHAKVDEIFANPPRADPGAQYAKKLYLNLSTLSPYVSGPNSVKVSTPLAELEPQKLAIQKAYILSCTNGRSSDFAAAAKVFKDAAKANGGKVPKIADGVKMYIAAASLTEQRSSEAEGNWQVLVEAGAEVLPSGCGPCIGLGKGLAEDNERVLSASNRNFVGRLGARTAKSYLSSPEVVAASALRGYISGTGIYEAPSDYAGVEYGYGTGPANALGNELSSMVDQLDSLIDRVESSAQGADETSATTQILPGFPEKITGEIIFLDADNLDTDNIYAGKYTYRDDMTREQQGEVAMENYDPDFGKVAKPGDILVSGANFGCGSSREQAATAILAKDIPLVVGKTLGNIFSRNSINNGLLGLESSKLVDRLRATFPDKIATRRTGWTLTWDVKRSTLIVQEGTDGETWEEKVGEFAESLQEIIARGGLENWVKQEIGKVEASSMS